MLHYMTITYTRYNLFSRKTETVTEHLRLTWEGVKYTLSEEFYRDHNATFKLAIYHGQKADN